MKHSTFAIAAIAVSTLARPAVAQDVVQFRAAALDERQAGISVVSLDPVSIGAIVKDAPYTAEAHTEMTQVLADGNRIERRTSATIARSSSGMTRREHQGFAFPGLAGPNEQTIVTITDPETGVHTTINYDLKTAFRMKPRMGIRVEGPAVPGFPVGPVGQGAIIAAPPTMTSRSGPPSLEPAFTEPIAVGGDVRNETLEPRTIEGVAAEGTRTTLTIPAGAVGNQLPIEIVSERWVSRELQIVLLTRRYDPRFGETIYRVTNIVRGEPAADLFKVPAGFRIDDSRP